MTFINESWNASKCGHKPTKMTYKMNFFEQGFGLKVKLLWGQSYNNFRCLCI